MRVLHLLLLVHYHVNPLLKLKLGNFVLVEIYSCSFRGRGEEIVLKLARGKERERLGY